MLQMILTEQDIPNDIVCIRLLTDCFSQPFRVKADGIIERAPAPLQVVLALTKWGEQKNEDDI